MDLGAQLALGGLRAMSPVVWFLSPLPGSVRLLLQMAYPM